MEVAPQPMRKHSFHLLTIPWAGDDHSLGCVWLTGCPHELAEHLALVVGIHT